MNEVYFFAAMATFLYVFLKAFQQRNVAFGAPWWVILLVSHGMAATEIYVVSAVVSVGYDWRFVVAVGSSAGTGAIFAMAMHRRLFKGRGHSE